jgi:hypothetical protein
MHRHYYRRQYHLPGVNSTNRNRFESGFRSHLLMCHNTQDLHLYCLRRDYCLAEEEVVEVVAVPGMVLR